MGWGGCFFQQFARILLELFVLTRLLELRILQRFVRILFELLVQPKSAGTVHFEPVSTILLEDDDDHTNDVVVVDDGGDGYGDDDDNDDNDPAELFQKRGKWWELIILLPYVLYLLHVSG